MYVMFIYVFTYVRCTKMERSTEVPTSIMMKYSFRNINGIQNVYPFTFTIVGKNTYIVSSVTNVN